jgi:hypothetical protein
VEGLARLGVWLPFAPAAALLGSFAKVTVSEGTARRRTERAGAAYEAVQTAQVEALEHELPDPPVGPAIQQVSVDGAMVPLVGGRWGEAKLLAIGTVGEPVWEEGEWRAHATELSYFGRMTDAEAFGRLATVETHRRGTATAGVVCAVLDGAEWQQGFVDLHRPDAVRILDFPHGAAYVAKAGQAALGTGEATATWLAAQLHALKHGQEADVLEVLAELRERAVRDGAAEVLEAVEVSLGYLEKRREQLRYGAFRAAGYPIGSGAVESGNKLVTEARLKGAGMHWAPEHVNPLLALRTAACSDRWDEAWGQLTARLRAEAHARTRARRAERQPACTAATPPTTPLAPPPADPDPAALTPAGPVTPPPQPDPPRPADRPTPSSPRRPAATHPWRRLPIGRARSDRLAS